MHIEHGIALQDYSTFHIGGPAESFVRVGSEDALREAIRFAQERNMPWSVIGEGSNILFADEGVHGLIIKNEIKDIDWKDEDDQVIVRVGAGMHFDDLVALCVEKGLWGLENLSGIPGSVGATPVQNVGAYGVEVSSLIQSVEIYDSSTDSVMELSARDCDFGYRDSRFKRPAGEGQVILHVTFRLARHAPPKLEYRDLAVAFKNVPEEGVELNDIRTAVLGIRAGKFPDWQIIGTAGSFFKNPIISSDHFKKLQETYPELPGHPYGGSVKIALGWVLDRVCGVRGVREGLVRAFEHQALVIVAERGARASDVASFAEMIASRVYDATNIKVEWEVTYKK